MTFHPLAILPTCHFVNLLFQQPVISSSCNFSRSPFFHLTILSTWLSINCHFVNCYFNNLVVRKLAVLPISHSVSLPLCQLAFHPPDGSTSPKYKLLCFITTKIFLQREASLAFNRDRCCHLVLCLRLIPSHWLFIHIPFFSTTCFFNNLLFCRYPIFRLSITSTNHFINVSFHQSTFYQHQHSTFSTCHFVMYLTYLSLDKLSLSNIRNLHLLT